MELLLLQKDEVFVVDGEEPTTQTERQLLIVLRHGYSQSLPRIPYQVVLTGTQHPLVLDQVVPKYAQILMVQLEGAVEN
jgi:hypothetical protein